ncbi:GNAT family N-acetyltransferase [Gloeocapsopsis dulcis]|uniref:GNAT family N-acetyltransferase n=1 Tax=Gloeocapsopsis dulcis AAB1 = 1H9 TaxID=1433147 RepID=A0A6N8G6Z2_9CHRO|nr:GNAT family N-acetyltransferase [Gloeocapsopsis dulcis]MUL39356.1 GNAT family N-acetyltransferase [Gloeocapsopsis dulcis AAB1 = 1H9]WNN89687.1 GNAT family N-acetyltransferase [Gloeocapsopsis dulcis]
MAQITETQRLLIRGWHPQADTEHAFQMYSDPKVTKFLITKVDSLGEAYKLLERWVNIFANRNNGSGQWAITLKETQEVVGMIALMQLRDGEELTQDYEIGWHLKQVAWGQGYATEAAKAVLEYGFNSLKLPVVYSIMHPENISSVRVVKRLGMSRVGRTNQYYKTELEMYQLEAHAWRQAVPRIGV